VHIVRLVDGHPVRSADAEYDARVVINDNGTIVMASYYSRTFEITGDVSIMGAAEAWQAFRQHRSPPWSTHLANRMVRGAGNLNAGDPVYPTSLPPPIVTTGGVEMIEGRLSADIREYQGAISSTQQISAGLSGWYSATQMDTGWRVELGGRTCATGAVGWLRSGCGDGTTRPHIACRLTVSRKLTLRARAVVAGCGHKHHHGRRVMRTFFVTQDGQRFILARSCNARRSRRSACSTPQRIALSSWKRSRAGCL